MKSNYYLSARVKCDEVKDNRWIIVFYASCGRQWETLLLSPTAVHCKICPRNDFTAGPPPPFYICVHRYSHLTLKFVLALASLNRLAKILLPWKLPPWGVTHFEMNLMNHLSLSMCKIKNATHCRNVWKCCFGRNQHLQGEAVILCHLEQNA